jgi:NAD(P)-dependent dehydrogenase (short-subunit alcohol dehydrogenase family)
MIRDRFDLGGKTAIITGAGSGLGRAMALAMADAGCDIVGAARRPAPLEESRALVEAKGRRFLVVPTDVTDSAHVNAMVERAIAEFGRIDIIINNAGGGGAGAGKTLPELSDEEWRQGIDTNLSSAFFCSRAIVPHFLERGGGRIINISSIWGYRGLAGDFMYAASKGALIQLTRALAVTYAGDNIRCTCIAPGMFPLGDPAPPSGAPTVAEEIRSDEPSGRAGAPSELGPLAVFLCSAASDYVSGETVLIDGGVVAAGLLPAGVAPVAEG